MIDNTTRTGPSVLSRIDALEEHVTRWNESQALSRQAQTIRESTAAPVPRTPIEWVGVRPTDEGVETLYAGAEEIDLGFELPALELRWDLRDGDYRVEVTLERSGTVSFYDEDGGELVRNRRVAPGGAESDGEAVASRTAVVDLDHGRVRMQATAPVSAFRLLRFERRSRGEVVIGPFRADGVVAVTAVGHGDWTCEVARDYDVYSNVRVTGSGGLALEQDPGVPYAFLKDSVHGYGREAYGENFGGQAQRYGSMPYSVAVQFDPDLPEPDWDTTMPIGRVYDPADVRDVLYEVPTPIGASGVPVPDHWSGVGTWGRLRVLDTPGFEEAPESAEYTTLWGRVLLDPDARITKAWSADTGLEVDVSDTLTAGHWLLRRDDGRYSNIRDAAAQGLYIRPTNDTVEFEGVWCWNGEPVRTSSDPLAVTSEGTPVARDDQNRVIMPPGEYRITPFRVYPARFLVRLRGAGVLRAIDITVQSAAGHPGASPIETTYREELSHYRGPDDAPGRLDRVSRPREGGFVAA